MVVPIANLSAVVTAAVHTAMGFASELLPTDVTRDAVLETARAFVAWFFRHLWAWLVAARAAAVEHLPESAAAAAKRAASSAVESSEPWLQMAGTILRDLCKWLLADDAAAKSTVDASEPWLEMALKLLHGLYGRLVAATAVPVRNLPEADAMATAGGVPGSTSEASSPSLPKLAWLLHGHGVAVYVLLVLAVLAVVFLCGAVWAITCRTMKGPGLGGGRIARVMFKANTTRYYATVQTARKARRGASGAGWKLLVAAPVVACAVYLAAKTIY